MLDGVSLDQLRTFIASADEGSFSAAARKLRRSQSAVSDLVSGLEAQMGVPLFDRAGRYPRLTAAGVVLLGDARGIVSGVNFMKARAKGMASGVEAELSVVVDVFFPIEAITSAAKAFRETFPATPLRLFVEALGGAYHPVLTAAASIGVVGSLPIMPPSLSSERLGGVPMAMLAAHDHPLASFDGLIPRSELARHVQLVLTDRSDLSAGREFGVLSSSTWRLADLGAKHAFLLSGLGWGGMPLRTVERDVAEGRLVQLAIEDMPPGGLVLPMFAVYPTAAPPGPAGRWFVERLKLWPQG
jgi:DNA-binding transcriptional LysR family regulator